MTQTYESGFKTTLAAKLNPTDVTMTVATAPTVTKGRLFIRSGNTKEWIKYTGVTGTTLTGLVRGLSSTADPATAGTGLAWGAGTEVILVEMHDQKIDKQEGSAVRVYADATARDADITSPSNGMVVYLTSEGTFTDYIAGTWANRPTAAVSDGQNASDTVAGRAELATTAETKAGTDTGGTGAGLIALPSDIAANEQSASFVYAEDGEASDTYVISLTPNLTAYTTGQRIRFKATTVNTGACTLNVDSLGAKSIKDRNGEDPVDGEITAGDIIDLIYDGTNFVINTPPRRATDAEVVTGTDDTLYASVKQNEDSFRMVSNIVTGTFDFKDEAIGAIDIAHGLGKVPRMMICELVGGVTFNGGTATYDGSTVVQKARNGDDSVWETGIAVYFADGGADEGVWAVNTIDTTNVNLTYSYTGTYGDVTSEYKITFIG